METRYDLAPLGLPPNSDIYVSHFHITSAYLEFLQVERRWSIFYMLHANTVQIKLHTYVVKEGDIVFLPPGSRVSWSHHGDECSFRVMTFTLPPSGRPLMAIPHVVRGQNHLVASMDRAMVRIIETKCAAMAFAWQVLWDVAQPSSVIRHQSIMYEAEEFIEENLGRLFAVEELCGVLNTEYGATLRAFRAEHGVSIQQFIVQKRVQEACRLLTASDISIKEVALRVGYVDLQQFNKMLRRHLGKSPSAVRDEYRPPNTV